MSRPVLEFLSAQRAPFQLTVNDVVIGRSPACTLILDAAGVGDRHARITVDASGTTWIENFEPDAFTMYNGARLTGRQKLAEGDRVEIGLAQLVFHASMDISVASQSPAGAKAATAARTMLGSEMPPELKKFLEERKVGGAAVTAPPAVSADAWETAPPTVADPRAAEKALRSRTQQVDLNQQLLSDAPVASNMMVGTPDPEPPSNRTVQMDPDAVAKINMDFEKPAPAKPQFKQTMIGIGTANPKPTPAPAPVKAAPQQATAFMEAPKLPNKAAPQQSTAFMEAPKLPAQAPKAAPAQPTAFMDAPKLPGSGPPVNSPHTTAPQMAAAPAPTGSAGGFPMPQQYAPPQQQQQYAPPAQQTFAPPAPGVPGGALPYTPPKSKGSFGSFSRAFEFMGQIFQLAKASNGLLWKPLILDIAITTPIMFVFAILDYLVWRFTGSSTLGYLVLGVEAFLLYFTDYLCNSVTCSLMYDLATTGTADVKQATDRVKKALPGVITFAAVSALLDVASTYARERNDVVSKIVLRLLRAVWTTATYIIMPALVIEGVSFGAAFGRSKKLMDQDPTGVGAGVVALSIISYAVAAVCFPLSYFVMSLAAHIPIIGIPLGAFLGMAIINAYWAISGWMKISYSTCFYLWARECEATGRQDASLAPAPLRAALEAA